jgi:hypothetical protein
VASSAGKIELSPGRYTVKASAQGYEPFSQDIEVAGGDNPPLSLHLEKSPEAAWPVGCFQIAGGWERAVKDCYYTTSPSPGTYEFEILGRPSVGIGTVVTLGQAKGEMRYGPWLLGSPSNSVECYVGGGSLHWRKVGGNEWQDGGKIAIPKDAKSIFVRMSLREEKITFDIGSDPASAQRVQADIPSVDGRLRLRKGTSIRQFKYSK